MEASDLNLLRQELREEQDAVTAAWIAHALALLEAGEGANPVGPAPEKPDPVPVDPQALEAEATAAAAQGDWRQAGVLWQRCRRPLPPHPGEVVAGLKRPGWW